MPHWAACFKQRNTIPVRVKAAVREGHGKLLQPNINVPSATGQKFSHENSTSHNWPLETMMSGKYPAPKIHFDHPSVSLGDQFACKVLHNNSSATFGSTPTMALFRRAFFCLNIYDFALHAALPSYHHQ